MKNAFRIAWTFVILLLLFPSTAFAQVQRMGIPAGIFNLAPGGARGVSAFCFDFTRHSPSAETSFDNVLTPSSDATVTVGGTQRMSLQEAIRTGVIRVHGTQMTFAQFIRETSDPLIMQRVPPEQRARLKQMAELWRTLTPAERNELEEQLRPLFAEFGDYTRIVFENGLPNKSVSVHVNRPAVFGGKTDSAVGIDATLARPGTATQGIQRSIWAKRTTVQQQLLRDAGVYHGRIDGIPGDQFKQSITNFQQTHGLATTDGILDTSTETVLNTVAQDRRSLGRLNNGSEGNYLAFRVEVAGSSTNGTKQLYRAYDGPGDPKYTGNNFNEMMSWMKKRAGDKGAHKVYLLTGDLPDPRRKGLENSLENYREANKGGSNGGGNGGSGGGDSGIGGEPEDEPDFQFRALGGEIPERDFFQEHVIAMEEHGAVTPTRDGKAYQQDIDLHLEGGKVRGLNIIANTKEIITSFVTNLKTQIATRIARRRAQNGTATAKDLTYLTSAEVVNASLAITRKQMGLKPGGKELMAKFHDQAGHSVWVLGKLPRQTGI